MPMAGNMSDHITVEIIKGQYSANDNSLVSSTNTGCFKNAEVAFRDFEKNCIHNKFPWEIQDGTLVEMYRFGQT